MENHECWKCHFRASRFKYFLREDAHRPRYKLAPSALAFKAPHFKYAPPSLCNSLLYGLPAKCLSKLLRVQSAAARLVAGTSRFSHITPLLYSLHRLPVKERIHYKIIYTDRKDIYGFAPTYLCSASRHLYHKSKACALIGQLAIFHLPIGARQRKASAINSLSAEV